MREFVKNIFNWRKTSTAVHTGKLTHFAQENGIYSYFRYNEKEKYWIILNKNKENSRIELDKYKEILPQKPAFTDVLTKQKLNSEIEIPAKGFRILRVE